MPAFDAIGVDAVGANSSTTQPPAATVSLVAAPSTESGTSSTGAATVTPVPNTINLTATGSSETSTSGAGAATVTPASGGPKTVQLVAANSTQTSTSSAGVVTTWSGVYVAIARPANLIPKSRWIVIGGVSRVVTIQGTNRIVEFKNDN